MKEFNDAPVALEAVTKAVGVATTLTVEELASLLKISVAHTYKSLKDGTVPCIRLGTRYIIPTGAVMRWLDSAHQQKLTP